VLVNTESGTDDSGDTEDSEDEIVENLADHITDCACLSDVSCVCTKDLLSASDVLRGAINSCAATGLEHLNDALSEFESLNLLEGCAEAIAVFIAVFRRVHVLRDEEIRELVTGYFEALAGSE